MRDVTLAKDEVFVSFDVSSLFTNVPIGKAEKAKLRENDDLVGRTLLLPDRVAELLNMCLRSTYLSYGGEFYEQIEGAPLSLCSGSQPYTGNSYNLLINGYNHT